MTTGDLPRVTIAELRARMDLKPGLRLEADGAPLGLTWTPCHYGGVRPWFVCAGCGRRCGALYLAAIGLRCRKCLGLAYRSQMLDTHDRLIERASAIRVRLGGEPRNYGELPRRPARMRLQTYDRLTDEMLRLEYAALASLLPWLAGTSDRRRA